MTLPTWNLMPLPTWTTADRERKVLQDCITEAKRRLDTFREEGNALQAELAEADINGMLEELGKVGPRHE